MRDRLCSALGFPDFSQKNSKAKGPREGTGRPSLFFFLTGGKGRNWGNGMIINRFNRYQELLNCRSFPPIAKHPRILVPMMWTFPSKPWFRIGGVEYERGMGLVGTGGCWDDYQWHQA